MKTFVLKPELSFLRENHNFFISPQKMVDFMSKSNILKFLRIWLRVRLTSRRRLFVTMASISYRVGIVTAGLIFDN